METITDREIDPGTGVVLLTFEDHDLKNPDTKDKSRVKKLNELEQNKQEIYWREQK